MRSSDEAWRRWGEEEPYFAALTAGEYLSGNLDEAGREAFFASGERHVGHLLGELEPLFSMPLTSVRALDFGCGPGRNLVPLARRCASVTGVDVAPGMLAEAARVCDRAAVENVTLLEADAFWEASTSYDLVHSVLVFQHVAPRRGYRLLDGLVRRLAPGGVGAVQLVYARHASAIAKLLTRLKTVVPRGDAVARRVRGSRLPAMEMHCYDLNVVLAIFHAAGLGDIGMHPGAMGEFAGVLVTGRRPPAGGGAG